MKKNITIGAFQAIKRFAEEKKEDIKTFYKDEAKKIGQTLLKSFIFGLSGGIIAFCVCLGVRLGLGL